MLIAKGLEFGIDAAAQVFAFLGRRGSGKTYAAGRFVEQLHDADVQCVILDPVGVWWGLRLAGDGKKPGLQIPVFGGQHGDIPLEASAGRVVAQLVAEKGVSLVLDVSEFTGADQRKFVADFAAELLHAKKQHRSALMVVMEEAQEFAPQLVRPDYARMVGAVEKMVKLGRNFGIGTAMISQRPQAVNKDILNQTECLFAFQLTGPQERKAIETWVQEKGADRSIMGELPGLPIGTALVWSPQWLGVFGRYPILPKRTYDASATPGVSTVRATELAAIDLDAVSAAMTETIEKAKADDPKELRRQVAEWKQRAARATEVGERATAAAEEATALYQVAAARAQTPVLRDEDRERLTGLWTKLERVSAVLGEATEAFTEIRGHIATLGERPAIDTLPVAPRISGPSPRPKGETPRGIREQGAHRNAPSPADHRGSDGGNKPSSGATGSESLGKGERTVLAVLAQWPLGRTPNELAFLAGYSAKASTLGVILAKLRRAGLVAPGQPITLTPEGLEEAGGAQPLPAGPELLAHWRAHPRMGEGERRVLDALLDLYPEDVSNERLCELTGYSPTASTMGVILSKLRKLGLVEKGRRRLMPEFVEAVRG